MRNKFLNTGYPGFHPIRKIRIIFSGLRYAILYDAAVAYKVVLSIGVLGFCFWYRHWLDFELVVISTGLMVISEMFNTTVEALCDFVESRENEKIRIIKDISAAAVGISILIWVIVLAYVIAG